MNDESDVPPELIINAKILNPAGKNHVPITAIESPMNETRERSLFM